MAMALFQSSSLACSSSMDISYNSSKASHIFGSQLRSPEIEQTQLRFLGSSNSFQKNSTVRLKALMESLGLVQDTVESRPKVTRVSKEVSDPFKESNLEHYKGLAEAQAPKFMVIACADSRVCPSSILGFQPGEAFVVRNVANLVPPHENGPTETNAALEFAVNSLEVENVLVVGHSCCGGIKALMILQDEVVSSFIRNWVVVGKPARLQVNAAASDLSFDQQCRHCEKESINRSLMNLLTYPWIEERVIRGKLSIHGGYYDFTDCTFEKWTLDYKGSTMVSESSCSIKNREFWA
ncbi:hypothetical protein SASPL_115476 [Salvia splendens]|uniref:Carbonic anhydrase n=1 Tax=Salvia splendens TaxID=180675 RepID=A0A8X9A1N1_SALSN|nr:hypothetical protein SASPL_115476 [Salvia splendens]